MSGDERLSKLVDFAFDHAKRILVTERYDELLPAFTVLKPDGSIDIIVTPWSNNQEKRTALLLMAFVLKQTRAAAYCAVSEGWMAQYDKDEMPPDESWPKVKPSERPDRVEVVVAFAATRSQNMMKIWRMVRNKKGRIVDLVFHDPAPSERDMLSGSFLSLFERRSA